MAILTMAIIIIIIIIIVIIIIIINTLSTEYCNKACLSFLSHYNPPAYFSVHNQDKRAETRAQIELTNSFIYHYGHARVSPFNLPEQSRPKYQFVSN